MHFPGLDSHIHPDALLSWCQRQVILCRNVSIENMTISWKNGLAFCAIIHRYRPDLIDFNLLKEEEAEKNNQLVRVNVYESLVTFSIR